MDRLDQINPKQTLAGDLQCGHVELFYKGPE